jgi:signal peptidase I
MSIWLISKKIITVTFWSLLVIVVIRLSFLDMFKVPSDSMKNTLYVSDFIITNKAVYSGTFKSIFEKFGIKPQPQVNDILVFRIGDSNHTYYVKRCVGLPGKTIEIRNSKVFLNNIPVPEKKTILHRYQLWYSNYRLAQNTLYKAKIDLSKNEYQRRPGYILISLNIDQKESLYSKPGIDSLTILGLNAGGSNIASSKLLFGPVVQNQKQFLLPFAGMKIAIDSNMIKTYKNILEQYEGVRVNKGNIRAGASGIEGKYYVFKNDYYFMMGDNRENSIDSRFFGPIPGKQIEGKVVLKI